MSSLADKDVETEVIRQVEDIVDENSPVYSWTVVEKAKESGIEEQTARSALRTLHLQDFVVMTDEITGQLRLDTRLTEYVTEDEDNSASPQD